MASFLALDSVLGNVERLVTEAAASAVATATSEFPSASVGPSGGDAALGAGIGRAATTAAAGRRRAPVATAASAKQAQQHWASFDWKVRRLSRALGCAVGCAGHRPHWLPLLVPPVTPQEQQGHWQQALQQLQQADGNSLSMPQLCQQLHGLYESLLALPDPGPVLSSAAALAARASGGCGPEWGGWVCLVCGPLHAINSHRVSPAGIANQPTGQPTTQSWRHPTARCRQR